MRTAYHDDVVHHARDLLDPFLADGEAIPEALVSALISASSTRGAQTTDRLGRHEERTQAFRDGVVGPAVVAQARCVPAIRRIRTHVQRQRAASNK